MSHLAVGALVFDLVCKRGTQIGANRTRTRGDLAQRVQTYQEAEATDQLAVLGKLRDEVASLRESVKSSGIEVIRHVGHCSDGCTRLTDFNGVTGFDGAPHQSKPRLPTMAELAERIRGGATHEQLGREYDRSLDTIRQRLYYAGYSPSTGEPLTRSTAAPRTGTRPAPWWQQWMDDANCVGTDPEEFFPEKGGTTRHAKKICSRCTVAAECLDYALTAGDRFGIFGGMSERDRRRLARTTNTDPSDLDHQEAS